MTAIRLGRERLTAVSNGFADLISDTCGSEPAIPNGFLNGSVFGNDMGSLVCSPGYWRTFAALSSSVLPRRTLRLTMPRLSNAGVPQFCRHIGKRQLFRFSSFAHICLVDGSPYRPEKRVAARRGVHIA